MSEIAFHKTPDGTAIAYRFLAGPGPTFIFLPGYMSDMEGGKATATLEWARQNGRSCLLLDYSGCGQSEGDFADGTLSRWRDEVLSLIESLEIDRSIIIGSSMGGWLMLMVGLALGVRLAGLVGIAAAPDFTDWGRSDEDKIRLATGETVLDDNPYGPDPTPMHAGFWLDGESNKLLDGQISIDCPVRLIHGQNDPDVPWDISLQTAAALRSDNIQVTLIKDGDHRLSREQDIALLLSVLADFPAT